MEYKKGIFLTGWMVMLLLHNAVIAQVHKPVQWQFTANEISSYEADLIFTATLEDGWHIYSQHLEPDGPLPTTFTFIGSKDYQRIGKMKEISTPVKHYDETFQMDIIWYANKAVFTQKVMLNTPVITIRGNIEFMVCTDEMCLPPDDVEFAIDVKADKLEKKEIEKRSGNKPDKQKPDHQSVIGKEAIEEKYDSAKAEVASIVTTPIADTVATAPSILTETEKEQSKASLWGIFLAGALGGFAALFMPCIFPMLPFTISFFTRSAGNGIRAALLYGLSIIVIYVGLGLLVTIVFGSDALNALSTNGIFNFFFFVLLVVFAASMMGAFELQVPYTWVSQADARSEKGGVMGIFFMAATLALVSFSCTAPIVGTLLVEATTVKNYLAPAVGMFGFSVALAIPFTLFALFPKWINALPKSGGWLNTFKVTLGFLELALALKFLSNVDLAYHWQWFDREVFLALWIIIFGLLGVYLLGKLTFRHDSKLTYLPASRLFIAMIPLTFTVYMIPGMWGAPLNAIAAFLPPQQTQDFDLYSKTLSGAAPATTASKKYGDLFYAPYGLNAFFDYDEGIAYAKENNKPVMLDFTGHACVNCRKMEATVWADQRVLNRLTHYVLIQLYVDDKTELPLSEQTISAFSGKAIKTVGNKWSDLQASVFNTNSQPWYVLLDHNGRLLNPPKGADYNAENFIGFLDRGLTEFKKMK